MATGHSQLLNHTNAADVLRCTLYHSGTRVSGWVEAMDRDYRHYGMPERFRFTTVHGDTATYDIDPMRPGEYNEINCPHERETVKVVWRNSKAPVRIQNLRHFRKVWRLAEGKGLLYKLHAMIERLRSMCGPGEFVTLGYDFANMSFSFWLGDNTPERQGRRMMHGGLIFHPGNTGQDHSLSVELTEHPDAHWSIHT